MVSAVAAIFIAIGCGLVGGVVNIVLTGESMVFPKTFVDADGNKRLIFGFIKELLLGAIAAPLSIINLIDKLPLSNMIYLATVSGIGSSAILNSFVQKAVKNSKEDANQDLDNYNVKTSSN